MTNVKCTGCERLLQVDESLVGAQINCPNCHQVLVVERFCPPGSGGPASLVLAPDPALKDSGMAHYEALALRGISPQSSMRAIQDEFPEGEAEETANDILTKVQTRLTVDLFLYPLWQLGEPSNGSGKTV
jgi:hypothetical protein